MPWIMKPEIIMLRAWEGLVTFEESWDACGPIIRRG